MRGALMRLFQNDQPTHVFWKAEELAAERANCRVDTRKSLKSGEVFGARRRRQKARRFGNYAPQRKVLTNALLSRRQVEQYHAT